jgi:hypothetical protein
VSEFGQLVIQAVENPEIVDRNRLLGTADAFLNAAVGGDPVGLQLGRALAYSACDFAVFGSPEDYQRLKRAAELFGMYTSIRSAIEAN